MKRKIILFLFFIFSCSVSFAQSGLDFLVIGDWGREGTNHQSEVAEQMGIWAEKNNSRFVISTGDNIYETGVTSVTDELFAKSFENIYTAKPLQIPWYMALGNHDYYGSVKSQIEYSKINPRWVMPSTYFAFTKMIDSVNSALFVIVDTNPFIEKYRKKADEYPELIEQDTEAQLLWLDSILANNKCKWVFVFGHHPVISGGWHGTQKEMLENFKPVFDKYGVDAYICGHDHDMQYLKDETKTHYFVSGAGSETRESKAIDETIYVKGLTSGFLGMKLYSDYYIATFFDYQGSQLFTVTVEK